jgi:hypothetical protein
MAMIRIICALATIRCLSGMSDVPGLVSDSDTPTYSVA